LSPPFGDHTGATGERRCRSLKRSAARFAGGGRVFGDDGRGALRQRLRDIAVAVHGPAARGHEQRARHHLARVGRDARDLGIAVAG
jgi:hypothetical protein